MTEDTISFGYEPTRLWKYITVDWQFSYPILLNGKEIGGFFFRDEIWRDGVRVLMMEGIELDPEYRNKGIGTDIIKMFREQCDLLIGSITEDEPKSFWKKLGAEFRDLPLDCFPDHMLPTIHTKEPVFFFMTDNPKAREWAETFAREVPKLMKKLPPHPIKREDLAKHFGS